jgi:hypothetical protein
MIIFFESTGKEVSGIGIEVQSLRMRKWTQVSVPSQATDRRFNANRAQRVDLRNAQ